MILSLAIIFMICFARSLNFTRSESGECHGANLQVLNLQVFLTSRIVVSSPSSFSVTATHRIFSNSGEFIKTLS